MILPGLLAIVAKPGGSVFTSTQWTNAGANNLWSNAANWTHGVPDATKDCIMGGVSNAECILPDVNQECLIFNLSNYTGNIHVTASANLRLKVHSDAILDSGCTTSGYIRVDIQNDCQLTCGGFPKVFVGGNIAGLITLQDDLNCFELDGTNDVVFDLNGFDILLSDASDAPNGGIFTDSSEDMISGGGVIRVTATSPVTIEGDGGTGVWAPIVVEVGSAGVIADADLTCASYTQNAGDLTTDGATMGVNGNFVFNGDTITDAQVQVGGTAEAHDTTITNGDFSGGTELDATDNCTDGGGNTNVDFGATLPVEITPGTLASIGAAYPGSSMFMDPGTWSGFPTPTFTYQVIRGGVDFGSPQVSQYFASANDGSDTGVPYTFKAIAHNAAGDVTGTESNAVTPIAATYTTLVPNPDPQGDYILSEGDLRVQFPSASSFTSVIGGNSPKAGGVYYVECELINADPVNGAMAIGVARTDALVIGSTYSKIVNKTGFAEYILNGQRRLDGASAGANVATSDNPDVIGITIDVINNQFKVRKNDVLLYTGTLPVGAAGNYNFCACQEDCPNALEFRFRVAPSTLNYPATATADHACPGWPQ